MLASAAPPMTRYMLVTKSTTEKMAVRAAMTVQRRQPPSAPNQKHGACACTIADFAGSDSHHSERRGGVRSAAVCMQNCMPRGHPVCIRALQ